MIDKVRTRIAPSPTGEFHIGSARTALFNWLFARHNKGDFIFRIEDTDRERSKEKFEENIIESLKWLGLEWDEFYKQSDRIPIYSKYIRQLLDEGKAFWCYHTRQELEKEREDQYQNKEAPRHICEHKDKQRQGEAKKKGIIRLAVNSSSSRKIIFEDIVRGKVEFDAALLGDFSIARGISEPLYNLAVVVDDYEMLISHIIRGEEHIANTPKQMLLQEALGFNKPQYAHIPLILAPDKSKLSKREGAVGVLEYKKQGYLPEALINYLVLLGFTPHSGKEILTLDELIQEFDLSAVHKSGAVFDIKKLEWLNSEYIRNLSDEELLGKIKERAEIFGEQSEEYMLKAIPMMKERMVKLSDIEDFEYFFRKPEYERGLLLWKSSSPKEVSSALSEVAKIISEQGTDSQDKLRKELDSLGERLHNRGLVYWPLRAALSGKEKSPDPVDIACALGKDETISRIKTALHKLQKT